MDKKGWEISWEKGIYAIGTGTGIKGKTDAEQKTIVPRASGEETRFNFVKFNEER